MDGLNKLSLPAVILIASIILGGFYYATQVSKQNSIEKQQQIKIEQEKQAKEESKKALNTCIANAQENYQDRWHEECKAQGKLTNKCIDIKELTFSDYLDKYSLNPTTYNEQRELINTGELIDDLLTGGFDYLSRRDDECSCRLSVEDYTNRFNEKLADDKANCLKRYPQ